MTITAADTDRNHDLTEAEIAAARDLYARIERAQAFIQEHRAANGGDKAPDDWLWMGAWLGLNGFREEMLSGQPWQIRLCLDNPPSLPPGV